MARTAAVFDVDGTILRGCSAERTFVRHLLRRRVLRAADVARWVGRFLSTFPRYGVVAAYNRTYLKGKRQELCEELAEECFRDFLRPRMSPVALRRIDEHRAGGRDIVLLSGTLDFLLQHFEREVEADGAFGTVLEAADGVYTGEVVGPFVHGRGKVEVVREKLVDRYDLGESWSYADSPADAPMLRLFGHPVLVNRSPVVARGARKAGFAVEEF